jgi:hypothetical protein
MSDLEARIQALREHSRDLDARIASFREVRNKNALSAAFDADKAAIKIISEADTALATLTAEQQTISSAIEQAEGLLREEHSELERRERTAQAIAAHKAAMAIAALNAELDTLMLHLADTFEKRTLLLRELARTEVPDPTYVSKLAGKLGPTRAACLVGLHRFIDIAAVAPQSHIALAATNPQLLAIGLAEAPTPPLRPTRRRNGGGG